MKKAKKQEPSLVLQQIREAMVKEELAIPIYSSHIQQTLFWSGLAPEKQDKIIASLLVLERDSEKHAELLKVVESNYLQSLK